MAAATSIRVGIGDSVTRVHNQEDYQHSRARTVLGSNRTFVWTASSRNSLTTVKATAGNFSEESSSPRAKTSRSHSNQGCDIGLMSSSQSGSSLDCPSAFLSLRLSLNSDPGHRYANMKSAHKYWFGRCLSA